MLAVESVAVRFGAVEALRGVSLQLARSEIVTLLGANGAGKSTLVRAISGQVPLAAGVVRLDGRVISGRGPRAVARVGVVQCPEGRRLFAGLTVEENLRLGAIRLGVSFERLRPDLERLIEIFPVLAERRRQRAGTLSGGEQQMVALARSLIARPEVLLLDEPALGLAPKLVDELLRKLPEIAARGVAILLVEQHARAALAVAHRACYLRRGEIALALAAPEMARQYDLLVGGRSAPDSAEPTPTSRAQVGR